MQEGPYARPALTEMGGKNPAIVTATADLDHAAEGVARAAFGLAGQKCSACSRAIVMGDVHDAFVERLAAWTARLPLGRPRRSRELRGAGRQRGRASRASRRPSPPRAATASWPPAADDPIVPGTSSSPPSSATSRSAIRWSATSSSCRSSRSPGSRSLDEALAEANAPAYGLTAGVFSADPSELDRFLDEIQAGVVYVNRRAGATTGAWPGTQSFCGWKSSGSTGKGGLGPYYLRAVHARAEPDRGRVAP